MEPRTNLNLLFISLCLVISLNCARSGRLAPSLSPAPQPVSSPSPSQAPDYFRENVDLYPLSPSEESEADSDSDSETTLDVKKDAPAVDFGADLHATEVNPDLKKICDQTDHSSLCLVTVLPFVKDAAKANVNNVLQVAVEAGSAFAKEALSEAKKLASKPGTPEDIKATLKDCEDGYDTAVDNFQKTLDAFAANDLGTMRTMLSAVITFVGDCQDQFTEMQVESPLTGYAEKLTEMASNCLAISSLEN